MIGPITYSFSLLRHPPIKIVHFMDNYNYNDNVVKEPHTLGASHALREDLRAKG